MKYILPIAIFIVFIIILSFVYHPQSTPFIPHEVGMGYDIPGDSVSFSIIEKVNDTYTVVRVIATSTPNTKYFQFTPLQSDYGDNRYIEIDCVDVQNCPTLELKLNY